MRTNRVLAVLWGGTFTLLSGVQAAEYFVNKHGSDSNTGQGRRAAFLSVQKGLDALRPGDTLTVGPGEYSENVRRANQVEGPVLRDFETG